MTKLEKLKEILSKVDHPLSTSDSQGIFLEYEYSDGTDGEAIGTEYAKYANEFQIVNGRVIAKCGLVPAESEEAPESFTEEEYIVDEDTPNLEEIIKDFEKQIANL